ncbi:MAG: helix-turn-helix domain-containing protein [bacterium]
MNNVLKCPEAKEKKFLDVMMLAEMLNVSQRAVRDWLLKGRLDSIRINVGRLVRFDQDKVPERLENGNLLDT